MTKQKKKCNEDHIQYKISGKIKFQHFKFVIVGFKIVINQARNSNDQTLIIKDCYGCL